MIHRTKHLLEVTKQAGTEVCQAKVSLWLATNYHHQVDQQNHQEQTMALQRANHT